jgi:hypothetical protein
LLIDRRDVEEADVDVTTMVTTIVNVEEVACVETSNFNTSS